MVDPKDNIWPDKLRIRDTQLRDDIGGAGMRIYTTAGQGYEKRDYIRGDLYEVLLTENRVKDAALDRAIVAIKTLPEDALGYGKSQDIAEQSWNRWPFRDELLAELEAAVQVGQKP